MVIKIFSLDMFNKKTLYGVISVEKVKDNERKLYRIIEYNQSLLRLSVIAI